MVAQLPPVYMFWQYQNHYGSRLLYMTTLNLICVKLLMNAKLRDMMMTMQDADKMNLLLPAWSVAMHCALWLEE